MKKLMCILAVAGLVACGGMDDELSSAAQAVDGSSSSRVGLSPVLNYVSGNVIGNAAIIGYYGHALVNVFHKNQSHWSGYNSSFLPVYVDSYIQGDNKLGWIGSSVCTEWNGVWAVCDIKTAPFAGSNNWVQIKTLGGLGGGYTPGANTVTVYGHGNNCTTNTKGTNPALWGFSTTQTLKSASLSGVANVGSGNLCTPYGMAAFCYDYNTGKTCMWGDDGSIQMHYDSYLVGLGFGNTGAAWYNSTIASWVSNQY